MITRKTTIAQARDLGQRLGEKDARAIVTEYLADSSVDMVAVSAARLARLLARLKACYNAGVPVDVVEAFGEGSNEAYLAWTSTLLEQAQQGSQTMQ